MNEWVSFFIGICIGFSLGCFGWQVIAYGRFLDGLTQSWKKITKEVGSRLEVGQTVSFHFSVSKFNNDDDDDQGGEEVPIYPNEESWRLN